MLHKLVPGDFEKFRDERLARGKAFATVRHELNIISQVYEAARFSWRMRDFDNPLKHVKRSPACAKPRNVRLKGTVKLWTLLAAVMPESKHCTGEQRDASRRCKLALEFAIETSLRRGEAPKKCTGAITPKPDWRHRAELDLPSNRSPKGHEIRSGRTMAFKRKGV